MLRLPRWTRSVLWTALFGGFALCAWASASLAQPSAPSAPALRTTNFTEDRPTLHLPKIAEGDAPKIDADLSDPIWEKAVVFDNFTQVEPNNGAPVSERTVARMMYDSNNLYLGVYCYDREPDKIVANVKARDGGQLKDDFIRFNIDPNRTRRDAYTFEIGRAHV